MSVLLSIDGPYFASGPIKFGDIRSTFGGGNNFGSYKRNTSSDATNPIVPDATENANISDDRNLRFGAFRNSVKSYTATQSEIDENTALTIAYCNVRTDSISIKVIANKDYIFQSSNQKKRVIMIQKLENQAITFDIMKINQLK